MPWTMKEYPDSFKNLSSTKRKKAIDIANALVDEGYEDGRAIPIAIEQAKEWYDNASKKEREAYKKEGDPTTHSSKHHSRAELLDEDVMVFWRDDQWVVKTKTAKKASKLFAVKEDAVTYGKQVAKNKGTRLHLYLKNGNKEKEMTYEGD